MTDINALDPVSDGGEGSLTGHVVQQHNPIRSSEVGLGHTSEPAQITIEISRTKLIIYL